MNGYTITGRDSCSYRIPKHTPLLRSKRMSSDIVRTHKRCSKCRLEKPITDFGIESRRPDGRRCFCKACKPPYSNRTRSSEHHRRSNLKRRFGMSIQEVEALAKAQGNACAICRTKTPGGRWDTLHVDHDHDTGKVRGLLCNKCNVALGAFGDDLAGVMRAVSYLKQYRS